jgi:hypothetical protein
LLVIVAVQDTKKDATFFKVISFSKFFQHVKK